MTNYNDGLWHGWNGGECPVRPETVVKFFTHQQRTGVGAAKYLTWSMTNNIVEFRVIKEHKEPLEFTIRYNEDKTVTLIGSPVDHFHAKPGEIIHVREVIEE